MSVGFPRSEQDDDGDACGILRSPIEFEEITSPTEIYQLTLLTLVNQSHKLSSAEDQWAVKPGRVVHGGEADSPSDDYSDYG